MARTSSPVRPERPHHTIAEKRRDVVLLQRRISELEAFDVSAVTVRHSDAKVQPLQTAIASTLAQVFGERTDEYRRYARATKLDNGPIVMESGWVQARQGGRSYRDGASEAQRYVEEGRQAAIALLNQAVRSLEEEIEFAEPEVESVSVSETPAVRPTIAIKRRVFVVHGHDEGAREAVARFLEKVGIEAIILHEQANRGRTIIEKIEAYGDVGFAVVLLTPDDVGNVVGGEPEPRARQNVLLELGYFLGRLGREHVCTLKRGAVSIPTDFEGVVWGSMDTGDGWKWELGKELKAAGFDVDFNLVAQ